MDKKKLNKNKVNLRWDGDRVLQTVKVPDHSFSAKEVLDQLQQMDGQLAQMDQEEMQLKQGMENLKKNREMVIEQRDLIKPFKEGCEEKQLALLKLLVNRCKAEAEKKAIEMSDKEVAKDPNALTEEQKLNQRYVMYQRLLGTNPDIANKISRNIITKHLFEEPIFENPFAK